MSYRTYSLHQLGWQPDFAQDLTLADFEAGYPARVVATRADDLVLLCSRGALVFESPDCVDVAVGDWVMVEHKANRVVARLTRRSLLAYASAGDGHQRLARAANLDALFIVAGPGDGGEFAPLRRYVTLALEAGVMPVVLRTAGASTGELASELAGLPLTQVVDAGDVASVARLSPWMATGRTVGVMGCPNPDHAALTPDLLGSALGLAPAWPGGDVASTLSGGLAPTSGGAWVVGLPSLRARGLAVVESVTA
ncbi:ribosome small subunit-dependent GTPase A [Dyella solisilvae]|uniref:Ribosome small subunit-dependent GTPase A n=1 Tax=Dyella solisilvae TaxID=1920168 RepID=A0A370KD45_9GAMM|nr:ribosome small subunit-dependent GTPase A [Dyella solisilvae]RDJ00574.1 ribosome small subunit-dependent GTPase A [Dyella solisilvae]